MLQLCSYETVALGYSRFCGLFSEEDFVNYEYYYDLVRILNSSFFLTHTPSFLVFIYKS